MLQISTRSGLRLEGHLLNLNRLGLVYWLHSHKNGEAFVGIPERASAALDTSVLILSFHKPSQPGRTYIAHSPSKSPIGFFFHIYLEFDLQQLLDLIQFPASNKI